MIVAEELASLPTDELDFDASWQGVRPEDPLTLIYTSGTTGDPKGVQLTPPQHGLHDRLLRRRAAPARGGRVVSYLPMAHIAERNCSHYFPMVLGFTVTCCPDPREVLSYFPEVRPSWFFAVPRLFEKLRPRSRPAPRRATSTALGIDQRLRR